MTIKEVARVQNISATPSDMSVVTAAVVGEGDCPECDNGLGELFCMAWNSCWEQLAYSVILVLLAIALIYAIIFKCLPCKLFICCCKGVSRSLGKFKSKKSKNNRTEKATAVPVNQNNQV